MVQQGTLYAIGEKLQARHCAGGIEAEALVLEVTRERLEVLGDSGHPWSEREPRSRLQSIPHRHGECPSTLHRPNVLSPAANLGNGVGVPVEQSRSKSSPRRKNARAANTRPPTRR